jgi:hypothetical protein
MWLRDSHLCRHRCFRTGIRYSNCTAVGAIFFSHSGGP